MRRLSFLTLGFAVVSVVFLLLLILFRTPFPLKPLMSWQDALDLLTPVVLIPLYWLMLRHSASGRPGLGEEIAFLVLSSLWVMGHGLHLSANSISNLMETLKHGGGIDATGTDVSSLTYFYDEQLSHYLWHSGIAGLAALLIYHERRQPAGVATIWWQVVLGGVLYGFTCFCTFLEGQTVALGLPFSALVVLFGLVKARTTLAHRPLLAFFFISFLVTLGFFAGWGLYWGGFPEFSGVGLI